MGTTPSSWKKNTSKSSSSDFQRPWTGFYTIQDLRWEKVQVQCQNEILLSWWSWTVSLSFPRFDSGHFSCLSMCVTLPAKIHIYLSRCSFCEYFVNILTTLRLLIDRQLVDLVRYLKCVVLLSASFALLIRVKLFIFTFRGVTIMTRWLHLTFLWSSYLKDFK